MTAPIVLHAIADRLGRPPIQQWAGHYLNLGFQPVPLASRTKDPYTLNWQNTAFRVEDFPADSNIGLRSLNGLVILDDDFPTSSLPCDNAFLPQTIMWGRPKKPRSKRVYRCPELTETITFTDIDDTHLYQLRVGLQDMAPPSIHPDTGERLKWSGLLLPPRELTREQLVGLTRYRWTVGLLAKYWPDRGRHDLRLAYARVLLETLELPDKDAARILEWVCRLGGSDDKGIQDAAHAIQSTRSALDAGKPAWGGPKVAQLLPDSGRRILAKLRHAYGKRSAIEEAVEELNERFAIVNWGNKVVVMETQPDGSIETLWPFVEFKKLLTKESISVVSKNKKGEPTTKPVDVASIWLKHKAGRQYKRLVYAMPGSIEKARTNDYNGWLGFTIKPASGDWSKNREHLRRIICAGNEKVFVWVLNWCANLVQLPGRHAMTAIVLRGGEGIGKGHFVHLMLGALFYKQQYLHIIGEGMLTGRFNEHLSGKVLVFADESTWGGDPKAADKLKGMVTESTVPIEPKFLPIVEEPSALHIAIASNNEWPIFIPPGDRRFQVMDVAEDEKQNDAYFEPLREELANGGLAAMLHDLLAHKVDEHALRHPLSTKGKRDITALSLKPTERWWFEKLVSGSLLPRDQEGDTKTDDHGYLVPAHERWPTHVLKSALHDNYLKFGDHLRDSRSRRSTQTELGMFLKTHTPMREQRQLPVVAHKVHYLWEIPSLEECRAFWAKKSGWDDDVDWSEWE